MKPLAGAHLFLHFRLVHCILLCCSSAATPGSVRPSIHSRNAPPAVETKVKSPATPAWLSAATVSPPPATETRLPSLVSAAAVLRQAQPSPCRTARVSNAPSGPFQTKSAAGLEHVGERLDRGRADVEDHLVGRDLVHIAGAQARRIGARIPSRPPRHRADGSCSRRPRRARRSLRFAGQVMLAERLADVDAARGEKGVGHAAADDQMIDLAEQVAEHGKLGRDLGPADHRATGRSGLPSARSSALQLRLHRPAGKARQQMRDAFGRGVGAVRGGESVVDVIVAERGHASGQLRDRSFPRRHESAYFRGCRCCPAAWSSTPRSASGPWQSSMKRTERPRQLGQRLDQLRSRHVGAVLPLGPAEMRQQQDDRAAVGKFEHRRQQRAQPRVVG